MGLLWGQLKAYLKAKQKVLGWQWDLCWGSCYCLAMLKAQLTSKECHWAPPREKDLVILMDKGFQLESWTELLMEILTDHWIEKDPHWVRAKVAYLGYQKEKQTATT